MHQDSGRVLWLVAGLSVTFGVACSGGNVGDDAEASAGSGTSTSGGSANGGSGSGGTATSGGSVGVSGATALGGSTGVSGAPTNGGTSPAGATGSGGSAQGGAPAGGTGGKTASGGTGAAGSTAAGTGAPETTPMGYGKGTTGGGSAKAVTVSSLAATQAAIDGYSGNGGLVLEYTGRFDFASIEDPCVQHTLPAQTLEIKNKGDITLIGKDGSSASFGIHIAAAASNIIIRNMTIALTPGGDASDIISIEGMSSGTPSNIWIDHNEFYTSLAECAGAGDTAFDGMVDLKKGADKVTISYNYMHDHHKVSLNGYTDSDDQARHVTFHHNLFERIGSRVPLQRHGHSHVLNNYFLDVGTSGVNVRMGGYSLVEGNYFERVRNPVTSRDSSAVGFWELRNNNLASATDVTAGNAFGISWSAGNAGTINATTWTTTGAFPNALGYPYKADPFQCIHDGLRAAVGAGKGLVTLKCK